MGCLSQEIEGTVSRRDGAAGQVCLRERVPGTPQPAGVRPGYKRAAGFLHPLRCYYPRKESEGKSRHIITIENRTRSAAGTAQSDRIPNLNPIGGRISTTQSNKTKIDRVSQPRKKKWKRAMPPGNPGGTTMEQSQATRKSGRNDNGTEPMERKARFIRGASEQGHAHLVCCLSLLVSGVAHQSGRWKLKSKELT